MPVDAATVLADILRSHFDELKYALADLCRVLCVTETLFRSLYLWQDEPRPLRIVS